MKASITIHLDDGKEVALTLDQAIELRDKLNRLAPAKVADPLEAFRKRVDRTETKQPHDTPPWMPKYDPKWGMIMCGVDEGRMDGWGKECGFPVPDRPLEKLPMIVRLDQKGV